MKIFQDRNLAFFVKIAACALLTGAVALFGWARPPVAARDVLLQLTPRPTVLPSTVVPTLPCPTETPVPIVPTRAPTETHNTPATAVAPALLLPETGSSPLFPPFFAVALSIVAGAFVLWGRLKSWR